MSSKRSNENTEVGCTGCSFPAFAGSIIAMGLSWRLNGDALLAILHFFCSWAYVAWAMVARTEDLVAIARHIGIIS